MVNNIMLFHYVLSLSRKSPIELIAKVLNFCTVTTSALKLDPSTSPGYCRLATDPLDENQLEVSC